MYCGINGYKKKIIKAIAHFSQVITKGSVFQFKMIFTSKPKRLCIFKYQ